MSQSPDKSIDITSSLTAPEEHPEYSAEERQLLLHVAHESIEASLEGKQISVDAPTPHLAEHHGAFTSLYLQGQLRGCVGYVFPIASVYRTVMETARAAAFDDRRFSPLQAREAPHLRISLSILSPLLPIRRRGCRRGPPRAAGDTRGTPRAALTAGTHRTSLGLANLLGANLPQSRSSGRRVARRVRNSRGLLLKFSEKPERSSGSCF